MIFQIPDVGGMTRQLRVEMMDDDEQSVISSGFIIVIMLL